LTKAAALKKLPKARDRFTHIIKFAITTKCGFTLKRDPHVDFWRFDTFKIPQVLEIDEL